MGTWFPESTHEILKKALKEFDKTEEHLKDDINVIKDWLKTQPHLPEISSDNHITNVLLTNKFSIENTKQKLDMYYTIRHLVPEIFGIANDIQQMQAIADEVYMFPLPKRTDDGVSIEIVQIVDQHTEKFDIYRLMAYSTNNSEIRLQEDIITTEIVIIDLQNVRLGHVVKVTPVHLKKVILLIQKVYNKRIKQFHFVNCHSYCNTSLNILKQLLKPKLAARIFVHEDSTHLGKVIPKHILPVDFGGDEVSLRELHELWKKKTAEHTNRFLALSKMKTDESLRPKPLVNDDVLGYHGNFRKLDMD
ncbi:unnamed protein product [Phaedon cochleariae]|uniref:CRAL-TRIO domain-containing protein n=1 Tax=Phaedon cochleariae TaxID=80249 RepID=A0A9P0DUD9_PHACE|nr:unnamed protein product [Phaedon cochleariae]